MERVIPILRDRVCGDCHKCCEGWTEGDAYGHQFYSGKPCFFLGDACTIYEDRPDHCQEYNCEWKSHHMFPEWMKPSISNVIITRRVKDGVIYFQVKEAGSPISAKVIHWLLLWALKENKNLLYEIEGGWNRFGGGVFLSMEL